MLSHNVFFFQKTTLTWNCSSRTQLIWNALYLVRRAVLNQFNTFITYCVFCFEKVELSVRVYKSPRRSRNDSPMLPATFGGKIWLTSDFTIVLAFLRKLFSARGTVKCKWDGRFSRVSSALCWLNHGNEADVNLHHEILNLSSS